MIDSVIPGQSNIFQSAALLSLCLLSFLYHIECDECFVLSNHLTDTEEDVGDHTINRRLDNVLMTEEEKGNVMLKSIYP